MSVLSSLSHALTAMGDNLSRSYTLRELNGLSDSELARKGLSRDQIVNYVYRDIRYL